MKKNEWFKDWFNTSYYHTLYKNRDDKEAERFVKNLVNFTKLPLKSKILDLACGKGRHSITLNRLGMDVIGVDLSILWIIRILDNVANVGLENL